MWGGVKRYWWGRFAYPVIYLILSIYINLRKRFEWNSQKYDIVIAFSGHWNDLTFVSENFLNSKYKIAWLHGALYQYLLMNDGYLNLYKKIKNLVVLIDEIQEEALIYNRFVNLNIKKIYNPTFIHERMLDNDKIKDLRDKYGKFWIMVALLMQPKDHVTLLRALKVLEGKYKYKPKILLLGDGPNRHDIENYIKDMDLLEQVILCGNVSDVENYYAACYGLVHSSKFEGFGMVILEALLFRKPVIVTKCGFGINEMLKKMSFKSICNVGDYNKMAELMYKLYIDKNLYNLCSQEAADCVTPFLPNSIKNELDDYFKELIS